MAFQHEGDFVRLPISLAIIVIIIAGCSTMKESPSGPTINTISGTKELVLNEQDLLQLGMESDGGDCLTEEYQTDQYSPLAQYSFCAYAVNSLNNTHVVLEVKRFTNLEDRNGTYQYESLHLRGAQGLVSEDDFGDSSRFYVNNESTVYYYHLWIVKNEYLIHITSKGDKEAGEYIEKIGNKILSKFG